MSRPLPHTSRLSAALLPGPGRPGQPVPRWLDGLAELLDAVPADPHGTAVVVAGRRGLGKTTLLTAIAEQARRRGWSVCRAGATGTDPHRPYSPLVEALEDELAERPGVVDALDLATVRTLAGVLPTLRADAVAYPLPKPYDAGRALRRALAALAAARPLVLLVDDLHAADPATAETVQALLRDPPRGPVLVVAALRPRRSAPALGGGLEADAVDGRLARWELTELDSPVEPVLPTDSASGPGPPGSGGKAGSTVSTGAEVPGWLAGVGGPAGADAWAEACAAHRGSIGVAGGNPRLLALLRSTCVGGSVCSGRPWWEQPEPELTAPALVLLAELVALREPVRPVAWAAAVAGTDFDLGLVGDILDASRDELLAGIDELLDADVLVPGETAGRFRFGHPALRAAAYWSAPTGWRIAAHAAAVATLRGRGAPVQDYARHAEHSAGDARTATAVLGAAARAVEHTDVERAIGWYSAAVRMLRGNAGADRHRAALLVALARSQVRTGRYPAARASLDERERLLPGVPADAREEAEVAGVRAELAWLAGDRQEARDRLRRAVERVSGVDCGVVARLHGLLAGTAAWDGGAVEGDLRWCDVALLSAVGAADGVLTTHALAATAVVRLGRGAATAATRCADEAARLVDRHTDDELARLPIALAWLGWAELLLERDVRAVAHLDRAVAVSRRTGHRGVLVLATAGQALLADRQGHPDRAAGLADEVVALAAATGSPFLAEVAAATRAQVAAAAGDSARAFALTDPVTTAPVAGGGWDRRARLARAAAQLADGDAPGCRDTVLAAGGGDELPDLPAYERVPAFGLLVRATAELERWDEARLYAKHAHQLAEELGLVGQLAAARLALVEAGEDGGEAISLLSRSVRDALGVGHLAVAARATVLAVRLHADRGDLRAAEAGLRSGEALARQLGSPLLAAAVEAGREQLWAEPDRGLDALETLSPREREIAGLVAQGLTNQQIARKLSLSPKTVETHLGRIFGKLEVSSRAEIANLVGRAGAVPTGDGRRPRARGPAPDPTRRRQP